MRTVFHAVAAGTLSAFASLAVASGDARTSLLDSVVAVREGIHDISADVSCVMLAGSANDAVAGRTSVAWADGMIRVEKESVTPGGRQAFVASTWDGTVAWQYFELTRVAKRLQSPTEHHEIDGPGLFESMAFFPSIEDGLNRGEPRDLVTILGDEATVVRIELDDVDGFPCHVVDVAGAEGGVVHRLWVDPSRSFMPRKQQFFFAGSEELAVDITTTAFAQVDGFWLPSVTVRSAPASPRYAEGGLLAMHRISLDQDAGGAPAASVNSGLTPASFDYAMEIPAGVLVDDEVTGETWIASMADVRRPAEGARASRDVDASAAAQAPAAGEADGRGLGPHTGWAMLAGGGLIAAVGLGGLVHRRSVIAR